MVGSSMVGDKIGHDRHVIGSSRCGQRSGATAGQWNGKLPERTFGALLSSHLVYSGLEQRCSPPMNFTLAGSSAMWSKS